MRTHTGTTQEVLCHRCGMAKGQWTGNEGRGIEKGGTFYCCKGCADNTGCMCPTGP